ncbi:MAG: general secretion pathway protein GspK [Verrucomicrobiales bacterium]
MGPRSTACKNRTLRAGALVAVLFVIGTLSLMLATTALIVRSDAELATSQKKAFRATQLAEMGIAIGANPVVKKTDQYLLNQRISDDESFSVKIKGEGGKFNINALIQQAKTDPDAGREQLEIILAAVGLEDDRLRSTMIDNLINWVDEDDLTDGGRNTYEKPEYEAEGFFNYPFNRPFYSLDEMLLVKEMNILPGLCPHWRDIFTIYSGGRLDVNEASAECLAIAALDSVAEAQRYAAQQFETTIDERAEPNEHFKDAQEVIDMRNGRDGAELTTDDEQLDVNTVASMMGMDPTLASARLTNQDQTTRIESTATVGDLRKRIVLIVRNRAQNPQILMREEVPLFD